MLESLDFPSTVFLYGFIICTAITLLYVLLGDILEAVFHVAAGSILNPTVIMSFFAILSGLGFILETQTSWSTTVISIISAVVSFLAVSLLHIFILVPISKAEQSTGFSMNELEGYVGEVIETIPSVGMGEVSVNKNRSINAFPATSKHGVNITKGTEVRIVSIQDGVLQVEPYQRSLKTE